jgi:hypothetical protein
VRTNGESAVIVGRAAFGACPAGCIVSSIAARLARSRRARRVRAGYPTNATLGTKHKSVPRSAIRAPLANPEHRLELVCTAELTCGRCNRSKPVPHFHLYPGFRALLGVRRTRRVTHVPGLFVT